MKICFFDDEPEIYPYQYGGKARTITNLANEFIKRSDVEKVTIMSRSINIKEKEFVKDGVLYVPLDDTNTIQRIKEACDEYDIISIHCCSFTFPLIKSKAKKVYFLHDVLIATAEKGSHLDKALGGVFDCVMAPSEYAKDIFDKNKIILGEKSNCAVIPRHINKELFKEMSKEEILNDTNAPQVLKDAIKKYKKLVFFPSRPIEEKGGKYIINVAGELEKNNICILGPFDNDNLPRNIINTNWIRSNDMKYYYSAADVTCNFSLLPESFSQVCIESIYCGTPVVSFGSGNIKYLSKITNAIFLCDKNNKSIIENINKAINYEEMNKEKENISNIFDKDKIINTYIETYKKLMGE